MKYSKYFFHPEALEEYLEAVSYYANISRRLAESFVAAVETGIENILLRISAVVIPKGVYRSGRMDRRLHEVQRSLHDVGRPAGVFETPLFDYAIEDGVIVILGDGRSSLTLLSENIDSYYVGASNLYRWG